YFEGAYKAIEGGLDLRFPWAEKWGARASTQYDFERESFTRHRFALRRYFHRFVLEVTLDVDYNENGGATPDLRYAATFVPLETFVGLAVEYARAKGAPTILRGIRTFSDFEYEFQYSLTNRALAPEVETIYVMSNVEWSFTSSRLLKEAVAMGADVSHFVPNAV